MDRRYPLLFLAVALGVLGLSLCFSVQNMTNFDIPGGYEHKECMRNVGGFPYIHAFHYYLRF